MSSTYVPIPVWSDAIIMTEIESASRLEDFNLEGKPLKSLGERLNYSSLDRVDNEKYILRMRGGEFIEFR